MTRERLIRLIAGTFILSSLALGWWVSPYYLLFTAFVGANLFQSALTRWCLMDEILKALGVRSCEDRRLNAQSTSESAVRTFS